MERTLMKGKLAELKDKEFQLSILIEQDIILLRNLIDPFEPELEHLKVVDAEVVFKRWAKSVHEYKAIKNQIHKLEEALHG